MDIRRQSYYHKDEGFDYEKFFYSIFSFTDPIIDGDGIRFTTIFIYEDKDGKPYAQYRIRDKRKKQEGFADEAKFLEKYSLYLYEEENENLAITKIYKNFNQLDLDTGVEDALQKTHLTGYFGEASKKIPNPAIHDASILDETLENYKKVEAIYVKLLLKDFGATDTCYFLPLPIIAYGNLVGILYFLYDETKFRTKKTNNSDGFNDYYRFLILQATREYERIILEGRQKSYGPKPEDPIEFYREIFEDLTKGPYFIKGKKQKPKKISYSFAYPERKGKKEKVITGNPFLLDLGYDDYYEHFARVVAKESEQLIRAQSDRIKTAIISIIIDSFAHNIGAHSLVALKWWFEVRYRIAAKPFPAEKQLTTAINLLPFRNKIHERMRETRSFHSIMDDFEYKLTKNQISLLDIIRFMDSRTATEIWRFQESGEFFTEFPIPVAQSVFHFFQYLRDKSAFWSGVARDTLFSGQMRRWSRIFRTFLNNALFLGTIAHSEGINRIIFYIEILDNEGKSIVGGEYAEVNLEVIDIEKRKEQGSYLEENDDEGSNYSKYAFLRKGKDFEAVFEALEKLEPVFLPNGIIGQHALYTLFENTLRNVKHYKNLLPNLQKNGVVLCVSLQEVNLLKRMDEDLELYKDKWEELDPRASTTGEPLYKVATWLHHPQKLYHEEGAKVNEEEEPYQTFGSVVGTIAQKLRKRVVDVKGNPVLGGSSQDKVCAAMLMNNLFQSIDLVDLNMVKRHYFPYVFTGSEFFQALETRKQEKFKPEDQIFHKSYNDELFGPSSDERRKNYIAFEKKYIEEIRRRRGLLPENVKPEENTSRGIIKKYFHVWKGSKCYLINKDFNTRNENLARFRILAVANFQKVIPSEKIGEPDTIEVLKFRRQGNAEDRKHTAEFELRNKGIIRLVEAKENWQELEKSDPQGLYEKAMYKWLGEWLGAGKDNINLIILRTAGIDEILAVPTFAIYLKKINEEWQLEIKNVRQLEESEAYDKLGMPSESDDTEGRPIKDFDKINQLAEEVRSSEVQHLIVNHGSSENPNPRVCNIRSHTTFFLKIFDEKGRNNIKSFMRSQFLGEKDSPIKLLETVFTHITIFDDRVFERIKLDSQDNEKPLLLRDQLRIRTYNEDPELFRTLRDDRNGLLSRSSHFIVIHLSFLESIYKTKELENGKKTSYTEKDVNEFYEEEIQYYYKKLFETEKFPPNIILVITSGRGRGNWFEATNHPQITFRPIESILSAIEDGLSLKDDFQVKFNLCNVLFGS